MTKTFTFQITYIHPETGAVAVYADSVTATNLQGAWLNWAEEFHIGTTIKMELTAVDGEPVNQTAAQLL